MIRGKPLIEYQSWLMIGTRMIPDEYRRYLPMVVSYAPLARNSQTSAMIYGVPNAIRSLPAQDQDSFVRGMNLAKARKRVMRSQLYQQIKDILDPTQLSGIRKVILFGGYTLTVRGSEAPHYPPENQHALAYLLKLYVCGRLLFTTAPDLFGQDPIYQILDKKLLVGQGFTVLNDPHGLLEVDSSSIVIATHLPEIQEVITEIALPAIIIQEIHIPDEQW